jgi:hypothetical protein
MGPPPLPLASPGGALPTAAQHLHAFPPLSPQLPSVDAGGAPMRHPRPLTAAELHVELEKEQEAVVRPCRPACILLLAKYVESTEGD